MPDPTDRDLLRRAARRAETSRLFLGRWLADYRAQTGLDEPAIAAELGCSREGLVRLALCRAPREGAGFRDDLASAAAHAGADLDRLISVVRRAQALATLRAAQAGGFLAAARDREDEVES